MKTIVLQPSEQDTTLDNSNLRITEITYINTKEQPNWSFSLHSHKVELSLTLILDGAYRLYMNHDTYTAKKGDIVIKNPGVLHAEEAIPTTPAEIICVHIAGFNVKGYPTNHLIAENASPILDTKDSFPTLREILQFCFRTAELQPDGSEEVIRHMTAALIAILNSMVYDQYPVAPRTAGLPVIDDVVEYLDQNYAKNISLEELSNRFYFSPFYLSRKFKEQTGYTINQYVIHRRIGESERMLLFEDFSIKEIAQRNGYSNLQHFYAAFKKYTGFTPNEFKELYNLKYPQVKS
jgi:AraC-like DNA-binding protein/mannose-6-phosphate isomerase-like protein (cupin superfamily)